MSSMFQFRVVYFGGARPATLIFYAVLGLVDDMVEESVACVS